MAAQKYTVLHDAVGRFTRGQTMTAKELGDGVEPDMDRLLRLGAVGLADSHEAQQAAAASPNAGPLEPFTIVQPTPGNTGTAGNPQSSNEPATGAETAAADAANDASDTTDGRGYTKPALLKIAGERGITVPSGATKADIVALIESQGGAPTTAETEVSTK